MNISKSTRFKSFLYALALATILLLIRAGFRVAELSGGFAGKLAQKQVLFMVLDGAAVLSACILLMVFHPGVAFAVSGLRRAFDGGFQVRSRMRVWERMFVLRSVLLAKGRHSRLVLLLIRTGMSMTVYPGDCVIRHLLSGIQTRILQ